jgi:hypothetical protein
LHSGSTLVSGFSVSDFNGYIAGGELRRSSPYFTGGTRTGTGDADGDPNFINLSLAENQDTSFILGNHFFVNICAAFPGFLPRWVRYSESAVSPFGRIPRGPRGILVASVLSPNLANGSSQAITTSVFTSAPGVVLATLVCNAGGSAIAPCNTQEKWTFNTDPPTNNNTSVVGQVLKTQLIAGSDFPQNSKSIRVNVIVSITATGAGNIARADITALDSSGVEYAALGAVNVSGPDTNPHLLSFTFDVPIRGRTTYDDTNGDSSLSIQFTVSSGVTPNSVQLVQVIGWKLGS